MHPVLPNRRKFTKQRRVVTERGFPDSHKRSAYARSRHTPAPPCHRRPRPHQPQTRPRDDGEACTCAIWGGASRAGVEVLPGRSPTLPEAEIAPGAARVAVAASAMPKGPKQQPPEPEWIGDGESTSPAGEARGQGGPGRGKRGEKGAPVSGEVTARETDRAVRGYCAGVQWAERRLPRQQWVWGG